MLYKITMDALLSGDEHQASAGKGKALVNTSKTDEDPVWESPVQDEVGATDQTVTASDGFVGVKEGIVDVSFGSSESFSMAKARLRAKVASLYTPRCIASMATALQPAIDIM